MIHSLTCADTGADCPGDFTAPTKEELMKHVKVHVEASHPSLELGAGQVEALVRTS